jgi:hypothetical protein
METETRKRNLNRFLERAFSRSIYLDKLINNPFEFQTISGVYGKTKKTEKNRKNPKKT